MGEAFLGFCGLSHYLSIMGGLVGLMHRHLVAGEIGDGNQGVPPHGLSPGLARIK